MFPDKHHVYGTTGLRSFDQEDAGRECRTHEVAAPIFSLYSASSPSNQPEGLK